MTEDNEYQINPKAMSELREVVRRGIAEGRIDGSQEALDKAREEIKQLKIRCDEHRKRDLIKTEKLTERLRQQLENSIDEFGIDNEKTLEIRRKLDVGLYQLERLQCKAN